MDEILNLIGSVSEGFLSYSYIENSTENARDTSLYFARAFLNTTLHILYKHIRNLQ